ncbi:MAG: type I methionyl aminopeptidase [Bacteroidota bacterium]
MMFLKTAEEIELMRKGADILTQVHKEVVTHVKPGITTAELDKIAETVIRDHNAIPSFKGYNGYPATLCTSVNEQVIHGIPSHYYLKDGDILSIDCGVYYQKHHTDAANTVPIGNISKELLNLLSQTKEALYLAIEKATTQHTIEDLGHTIEQHIKKHNYHVIKEYGGHGIGKHLHEEPHIPNYPTTQHQEKIKNGMVLAIEPIVSLGQPDIYEGSDGWTVQTKDLSPTAHYEHTIAIINNQPEILTKHL